MANIEAAELKALKKLAKVVLGYSHAEMAAAITAGVFVEVECNGKTVS